MSRELGIRLYYLRTHRTPYNHRQIAALLHVDRSTYTKYENGTSEPSLAIMKKLRDILGVGFDELMDIQLSEEEIADYEMASRAKRETDR